MTVCRDTRDIEQTNRWKGRKGKRGRSNGETDRGEWGRHCRELGGGRPQHHHKPKESIGPPGRNDYIRPPPGGTITLDPPRRNDYIRPPQAERLHSFSSSPPIPLYISLPHVSLLHPRPAQTLYHLVIILLPQHTNITNK